MFCYKWKKYDKYQAELDKIKSSYMEHTKFVKQCPNDDDHGHGHGNKHNQNQSNVDEDILHTELADIEINHTNHKTKSDVHNTSVNIMLQQNFSKLDSKRDSQDN